MLIDTTFPLLHMAWKDVLLAIVQAKRVNTGYFIKADGSSHFPPIYS